MRGAELLPGITDARDLLKEPSNLTVDIPNKLESFLNEIVDRLWSNNAAVMVGAGFSKNAKPLENTSVTFPSWQELGDAYYKKLYGEAPSEKARYLNLLRLSQQVEAKFGRSELDNLLRNSIPDKNYKPSKLHIELLKLPWKDVFTTNYDTLLERVQGSIVNKNYNIINTKKDLVYSNSPRIVKLHGSLPSPPFTVTEEDYRRYSSDHAPFVNTVHQSMLENTLCLLGFSGDDPNFLQWTGWIRDHIGKENMPKIYWVGISDELTQADRKLSDNIGITEVNLSEIGANYETALRQFLKYLYQKTRANYWPTVVESAQSYFTQPNPDNYTKIFTEWRRQRKEYPGWVVMPEEQRKNLWHYTIGPFKHFFEIPPEDIQKLNTPLDLDLAFELAWRLDRCLVPLVGNLPAHLEHVAKKYSSDIPTNTLEQTTWTKTSVFEAVTNIRLWLLRYYREQGLDEKWLSVSQLVTNDFEILPPEHKAKFRLEAALRALFKLNIDEAKKLLTDWKIDDILPFWEAKRATLLAELGEGATACSILENSLSKIRQQLKLTPVTNDYTLVSQESVVMLLFWIVKCSINQIKLEKEYINFENELSERWDELVQFKCEPRRELRLLSTYLEERPVNSKHSSKIHHFDLGVKRTIYHFTFDDVEATAAYGLLRMCEDFGMPYCINNSVSVGNLGELVTSQIRSYNPHWTLVNIVRLGDVKTVDRLFNREYLHELTLNQVDNLFEIYLPALEYAISMINNAESQTSIPFERIANPLLEAFSRLCYKCSSKYREKLVSTLRKVYGLTNKQIILNANTFASRLLHSMTVNERTHSVSSLVDIPLSNCINESEIKLIVNPILMVSLPESIRGNSIQITEKQIDTIFDKLISNKKSRDWTLTSLVWLFDRSKLNKEQTNRLAEALWDGLSSSSLPKLPGHTRFKCALLPSPSLIEPKDRLKQYLRQLIAKELPNDSDLEELNLSAYVVEWSVSDILQFVMVISKWWKDNKYLMHPRTIVRLAVVTAERRRTLENAINALSTLFEHLDITEGEDFNLMIDVVQELISSVKAHEIPISVLEATTLKFFPEKLESINKQLVVDMLSNYDDVVNDALLASLQLAKILTKADRRNDFTVVANKLVEGIQWRHRPKLARRLNIVGEMIFQDIWRPSSESLVCLVQGLAKIKEETSSGIMGNDENELVQIRAAAAYLASVIFRTYKGDDPYLLRTIRHWWELYQDTNEFSEIKNAWEYAEYQLVIPVTSA